MRSHRLDTVASAAVMDHLIRRECARADRNGQVYSLVLFRIGANRCKRTKSAYRLARVMLKRARLTDDVGWVGEQHIGVLLPDTQPAGARAFADGVCQAVSRHEARPLAMVYTYPRDGAAASVAAAPETNRVASLLNANGHTRQANANSTKFNKPARINGNARLNGNAYGHDWMNGDSASTVALLDKEPADVAEQLHIKPQPRKQGVKKAPKAENVAGIEELLAFPMPRWKRVLDIVSAVGLMMLLSPVLAIAAIAIKCSSPGPVIFTQRRAGLGGKPFLIYKFRTMIVGAEKQQQELRKFNEQDGPAFKLTRDPRVTRIGAFLRKTSIDELPQLWNILRGEMSLVGPRPLPIAEQDGCEQWQRHRLNVTPGITCIWQVKGRSEVTFAEWVRMDVEYIRRRTILHDLAIILSTIPSVLLRKGAR